jgi:hypothetical protein
VQIYPCTEGALRAVRLITWRKYLEGGEQVVGMERLTEKE